MVDRGLDQADGLRRMFGATRTRVLEIAAGMTGIGRTSLVVNLGAALARTGRNTLLLDFVAQPTQSRVHRYFGMLAADDAVSRTSALPVADGYGIAALSHRDWRQSGPLSASAFCVAGRMHAARLHDWILVNGAAAEPVVTGDETEREVLIVLSAAAASITDAYGLLKRMAAADPRCRFRVVVNRVQAPETAQKIFANIAQVARTYLDVPLEYVGYIPDDAAVVRAAAEGTSVLEFAPGAAAAQAYARLAEVIAIAASSRPTRAASAFDLSVALGAA